MSDAPYIRITHADGETDVIELEPGRQLRFGSGEKADVALRGEGIRAVHLGVISREGRFVAVAAKAVGFFKHNQKVVSSAELSVGDQIVLGEVLLEVCDSSTEGDKELNIAELESLEPLDALDAVDDFEDLDALDELDPLGEATDLEGTQSPFGDDGLEMLDAGPLEQMAGAEMSAPGPMQAAQASKRKRDGKPSKWLHRVMILTAILLPFVASTVAILLWPLEFVPPVEPAKMLSAGEWDSLRLVGQQNNNPRHDGLYGREVRAWSELADWRSRFSREAFTNELADEVASALDRRGASFWEAGVQRPLRGLVDDLAREGLEEATRQLRRRNNKEGNEAVARVMHVLRSARSVLAPSLQTALDIDGRLVAAEKLRQRLAQPAAVETAVAEVREAGKRQGIAAALDVVDRLLASYPSAAADASLGRALRSIAEQERQRLAVSERTEQLPALEVAVEALRVADSTNSSRWLAVHDLARNEVDIVTRDAQLVARCPGSATVGPAQPTSGGDAAIALAHAKPPGVFALDGRGKLAWAVKVPAPVTAIEGVPNGLVVALSNGELLKLDIASGNVIMRWTLPLDVRCDPVVDERRGWLWVACDRALVIALHLTEGRCERLIYTGHLPGTVTASPVLLDAGVILVERRGLARTRVRMWEIDSGKLSGDRTLAGRLHQLTRGVGSVAFAASADGRLWRLRANSRNGELEFAEAGMPLGLGSPTIALGRRSGELLLLGKALVGVRWLPAADRPATAWRAALPAQVIDGPWAVGTSTFVVLAENDQSVLVEFTSHGDQKVVGTWDRASTDQDDRSTDAPQQETQHASES